MEFSEDYPNKAPVVKFRTRMYHPNSEHEVVVGVGDVTWTHLLHGAEKLPIWPLVGLGGILPAVCRLLNLRLSGDFEGQLVEHCTKCVLRPILEQHLGHLGA